MRRRLFSLAMLWLAAASGCTVDPSMGPIARLFPRPLGARVVELESENPDVRRKAVEAVAKSGKTETVPSLVRLLCLVVQKDRDAMVRSAAVQALGGVKGEGVLETLVEVLVKDENPYVRSDAAGALGRQAVPDAVPVLIEAMQGDASVDVRLAAEDALRNFKDRSAAEVLVNGLEKPDIAEVQKCWESLRYMTGQDLPREPAAWDAYLASAEDPFARHGRPPPLPKGQSQRPKITKGLGDFFKGLFEKDVRESELE
jgi:hypothetical protein